MSTANKPTFHQALGSHASSNRAVPTALRRVRDLPGESKLKLREPRTELIQNFPQDEDAVVSSSSSSGDSDSDSDAELMRELARIKAERAAAQEKLAVTSNSLVLNTNSDDISRRWDDDTIFKNQSRQGEKRKIGFINDAVRTEFHRKFLSKYIG